MDLKWRNRKLARAGRRRARRVIALAILVLVSAPSLAVLSIYPSSVLAAQGLGIVKDEAGYGESDLWKNISKQPKLKNSTDRVCELAKVALQVAAALGVLAAMFNMIRAAKEGHGGRWRIVFLTLIMAVFLVTPKTFFEMMGMGWLADKGGMWSCILK